MGNAVSQSGHESCGKPVRHCVIHCEIPELRDDRNTDAFCIRTKVSETRGRAKGDAAEDGQDDTPQAACNAFMMTAPL